MAQVLASMKSDHGEVRAGITLAVVAVTAGAASLFGRLEGTCSSGWRWSNSEDPTLKRAARRQAIAAAFPELIALLRTRGSRFDRLNHQQRFIARLKSAQCFHHALAPLAVANRGESAV